MIEDSQIVIDWMQGLPVPQVVMELIACQCNRVCKATECQCVANVFECLPALKNHLCDNMIDNDIEGNSVDDIRDEMIIATTKMHKITKMSIVYTMMMLADC